jgi:hypothetical protein
LAASTSALASNFTEVTATWYSSPTAVAVPTASGWLAEPAIALEVGATVEFDPDDEFDADVPPVLDPFSLDPLTVSETPSSTEA